MPSSKQIMISATLHSKNEVLPNLQLHHFHRSFFNLNFHFYILIKFYDKFGYVNRKKTFPIYSWKHVFMKIVRKQNKHWSKHHSARCISWIQIFKRTTKHKTGFTIKVIRHIPERGLIVMTGIVTVKIIKSPFYASTMLCIREVYQTLWCVNQTN